MISIIKRQKLNQKGPFYIYHIPNKKIGVSINPKNRVNKQQNTLNYEILEEVYDVVEVSDKEQTLQKLYGYRVDSNPYFIQLINGEKQYTPEAIAKRIANTDYKKAAKKRNNTKQQLCKNNIMESCHTPEAIAKRIANINWKKFSEDRKKPILQFDKQNNFIKEWPGIIDAAKILNIGNSAIQQCCNGKQKTSGGFVWKYKNNLL
jgi:hypothetical protein